MPAAPGPGRPAARLPLAPVEWACLAFAAVAGFGFLAHEIRFPSAYDAVQYFNIAQEIAARGVLAKFEGSEIRTYGYPWLASAVLRAASTAGVPFVALLFAVQFAAYVAAALFLRRALAPASALAARVAFCGLAVNVFALVYTPESMTESISLTLLVLAAAIWVVQWRSGMTAWAVLAGSLIAGYALVVRPGNLFVAAAWCFGLAVLWLRQRPRAGRSAFLAVFVAIGIALPVVPQVAINATHHGKATPFPTADLGLFQQVMGIRFLKYATGLPPVTQAPIGYRNPMLEGTELSDTAPLAWYADYPLRAIATVLLHTFNLTDQDLFFTYSRDLRPWYRIPLGVVNHAVVALGVVGLALFGRRARRDRHARDAFVVLVCLLVTNWAVYAWTAVEMRFGATQLLVLFPFAVYAMIDVARRGARTRRAVTLGTGAYIVFALVLSGWVRDQSPLIRSAAQGVAAASAAIV